MSLHASLVRTCDWYQERKIARIAVGREYEPPFSGRLMNDRTGAGQGAGTRIAFDLLAVPPEAITFTYNTDSLKIPYILTRVQAHGGLAFVLIEFCHTVRLCSDVKRLTLRRPIQIDDLPAVSTVTTIHGSVLDFMPVAIKYCQTREQ